MDKKEDLSLRLTKLEKLVSDLEAKLSGYPDFESRFIQEVIKTFSPLIDSVCKHYSHDRRLRMLGYEHEDLHQEVLLYLLRWCSPASRAKSTSEKLWFPYLKRSIKNCIVNLLSKKGTDLALLTEEEEQTASLRLMSEYSKSNVSDQVDFYFNLEYVRNNLSDPDAKRLFSALTNPKKSLSKLAASLSTGIVRINENVISAYFGWTLRRSGRAFTILKKEIRLLSYNS